MTGTIATGWMRRGREPALPEMLDDPIVAALMRADGVGRGALEADLHRLTALRRSLAPWLRSGSGDPL
jgi:hypothetical protein